MLKRASGSLSEALRSAFGRTLGAVTSCEAKGMRRLLCSLVCVGYCSAGIAQVATPTVKQQVTVTASRTTLNSGDSAAGVRTLKSDELRQAPALSLDDRLRQVPGLELYRRTSGWVANPTTQGVSLRGLGSTAASRTLVLSDEVPVADPFGAWVHWNEVPALAIESVDVLRGGASDLYGSSAIGGVINIIPVSPMQVRRTVQVQGGGLDSLLADGVMTAAAKRWSGLGAASLLKTDGYVTVAPEQRGAVDSPSGVQARSGRGEVRWASDRVSAFGRGNVLDERRQNGTPVQRNGTRLWRYQAGGDAATARMHGFLRAYGSTQRYSQTFSSIGPGRATEFLNRIQMVPSEELGEAAQIASTAGRFTFVSGFDVRDVRATDREAPYASGAAGVATVISARQRSMGGYVEVLWAAHGWNAAVSGRADNFRTFDARKYVGATASTLSEVNETVFNPRAGLSKKLPRGFSLDASGFRAFRGPSLNELYRSSQVGQQLTLPNDALRSERATGAEGAVASENAVGTVRAAYFWTTVNRPVTALLLTSTPASQTLQRANLGQIQSRGVSVDVALHPVQFLRLSGGYQYAVATVTRFDQDKTLAGKWIPEVPRHAATVQVRAEKKRLGTVTLALRNSGRMYDDAANSALLHGYFRVDLRAEHKLGERGEVFADVQNLFDRRVEAGRTPTLTLATPQVVTFGFRLHARP